MTPETTDPAETRRHLLATLIRDRAWQQTPARDWVTRAAEKLTDGQLDQHGVEWAISRLRTLPFAPIPDGRYLVDGRRYRCSTEANRDSRWFGWTTVNNISSRGGETLLRGADRMAALAAIRRVGYPVAAVEYGLHTRRCGFCHLQLTDERSLRAGVGRDCAGKHGITW